MVPSTKDKLEILHVIGAFCAGGAERFVGDLSLALSRAGVTVGVIALSSRLDSVGIDIKERLELAGLVYDCGPTESVGMRSVFWYVSILRTYRPLIVHLHTENTELAHWLARPWIDFAPQIVRTMHNARRSTKYLHRLAFRGNSAKASIACGPAVARRYDAHVRRGCVTIQNGIDFDWPIQTPEIKHRYQQELGIDPHEFHYLNVGSMSGPGPKIAQKGHDVLLAAWRKAGLGDIGARLHLIGDGNLRELFEKSVAGDGSVSFYGVRSDVKKWLLAVDCFVMPSRYEGLPIAAIEALGTGLPCIFSDIEPLMGFSGPLVLRVATDNVSDLSDKLTLARHRELDVDATEIARIREYYGIDKTAAMYLALYESSGLKHHTKNQRTLAE